MTNFQLYNETDAPAQSRPALTETKKQLGFIPSPLAALAASPAAAEGYRSLSGILAKQGKFTPVESHLVQMAISEENDSESCVSVLSHVLKTTIKADRKIVDAVRRGEKLSDPKLDTLILFTRQVAKKRGNIADADVEAFFKAGYTPEHLFEIVALEALRTMTNYAGRIAKTSVNPEVKGETWTKKEMKSAA